jgi:hypothetical protein
MPPGRRSRPRSASGNGGVPWLSLLSDRWHPAGNLSYRIAGLQTGSLYLFFLPHVSRCHQRWWRSMAFPLIGTLVSRPAVFIFSSCRTWGDATRMVAFHGFPSYRIAGILPALLLMERWSPDRQSLSFLPAARLPMPPGRRSRPRPSHPTGCQCVGNGGVPWLSSYRIAGIPAARQPMMASHVRATYTPNSKFLKYLFSTLYFLH